MSKNREIVVKYEEPYYFGSRLGERAVLFQLIY